MYQTSLAQFNVLYEQSIDRRVTRRCGQQCRRTCWPHADEPAQHI
jgi:hypothetical protein